LPYASRPRGAPAAALAHAAHAERHRGSVSGSLSHVEGRLDAITVVESLKKRDVKLHCSIWAATSLETAYPSCSYAKASGFESVAEFYDQAISGADPITDRPGFAEMLAALLANGARTIIVESPDRFTLISRAGGSR
jgi:hypothetical protein